MALLWFGSIERDQGNFLRALEISAEASAIAHKIESPILSSQAAAWTCFVYEAMGEFDRAKVLAEEALDICETNRLIGSAMMMRNSLGTIALYQGDIDEAIRQLEYAREGHERQSNPNQRARTLMHLGFATHLKGDSTKGEAMLDEALQAHWKRERISAIPGCLIRFAWVAVDQRDFPRAVRLMGAVEALHTQLAMSFPASEQIFHQPRLQAAKSGLSQADFESFWREGQAMDCKAAVDYVLRGAQPPESVQRWTSIEILP